MPLRARPWAIVPACVLSLAACGTTGPDRVRQDQTRYADAIGGSAKEQMLLNIVKLRSGDVPSFLSVGQVTAGYSRTVGGSLGTGLTGNFNLGDDVAVGATGSVGETPSVVYKPLAGRALSDVLFTPVRPSDLLGFLGSGTPDEVVLGLGLKSIGPYRNSVLTEQGIAAPDPGFAEVVALLGDLFRAGRLAVVPSRGPAAAPPDGKPAADRPAPLATVRLAAGLAGTGDGAAQRLRDLLELPADGTELQLVEGFGPGADRQIRLQTRTLIEILNAIATGIDAPEGATAPVRITSSLTPPVGAFAVARYNGRFFAIDDADITSKRGLSMVLLLLEFAQRNT